MATKETMYGQCPACLGTLTSTHYLSCPANLFGKQEAPATTEVVAKSEAFRPLTFEFFAAVNTARRKRWHEGASRTWVGPDWGNELAGETGELCNLIKKVQRFRDGISQRNFNPATAGSDLMKEIGDVVICAELIAEFFDFSLAECVKHAFNTTSEKNGFPERL